MTYDRNKPCHCGSGRKYKHCHYRVDTASPEDKYTAAQSVYAQNWAVTSAEHFSARRYHWMAEKLRPFSPKRILDIGCGSGHGIRAMCEVFGADTSIVSLDENYDCILKSEQTLNAANIKCSIINRLKFKLMPEGYLSLHDEIENLPDCRVTLISSDVNSDGFLEQNPEFRNQFDAVTIWLVGTHLMRQYQSEVMSRRVATSGEYRLFVQNRVYELASKVLKVGGVLHVVDRGEVPRSQEIRDDFLRSHREQASATDLEVRELDHIEYIEPENMRTPMQVTLPLSGRTPDLSSLAMMSIISVKSGEASKG